MALRRTGSALAVEERVHARHIISTISASCYGGFRPQADDPPKPWRRWVWFLGTTGLPVELHWIDIDGYISYTPFNNTEAPIKVCHGG
jgi:hypothetical protein